MPLGKRLAIFRSRRFLFALALIVALLALGGRHVWSWYHLWSARSALTKYQPQQASKHLDRCLTVWPRSVEVLLLSSRAARQQGDYEAADRHLRACQEANGNTSEEIALEWAMLNAVGGNLSEVEEFLQRRAERDPANAPLIWEAVAEAYTRGYRMLDALACLKRWEAVSGDNLRIIELRGMAYQSGRQARMAAADYNTVIERDPTRDGTRWRLILCLLDMGSYDEALPHLRHLEPRRPNDPELQIRIARCLNMRGQGDEARRILDAVLQDHPKHALALRTRGQFSISDRRPAEAEQWLRRAAELAPGDYQTQWLYWQALQQQNRTEEAKVQLQKAEKIKDQAERFGELTGRKLFEQPLDPALHYETGVILLRRGFKAAGEEWLHRTLNLDDKYAPAHKALAEFYDGEGKLDKAEFHRSKLR